MSLEENKPAETNSSASSTLIPGAIVVAGFLIAAAVVYTNLDRTTPNYKTAATSPYKEAGAPVDLADDDPFLGNPEAPVTIVEFGDYQCPFCRRFFETTEKEIIETYVKTGKVKFVYRDFPLSNIHPFAQKAAEASECAEDQGKFWEYHDVLYQRQEEISFANLKIWARELKLNTALFDTCLDSGKYAAEVDRDYTDGVAAGVTGTPASFVNGRLVSGAVPFAQFQAVIEAELKK